MKFTINKVDHEVPDRYFQVNDLNEDMDGIVARMAHVASLHGAAEAEREVIDTAYRSWKAKGKEALLNEDPKLAEWKVVTAVEARPEFKRFKEEYARALGNTITLSGLFKSLEAMSRLLQSRGAMVRTELDRTGVTTYAKAGPTSEERRREREQNTKKLFKTKKATNQ